MLGVVGFEDELDHIEEGRKVQFVGGYDQLQQFLANCLLGQLEG